MRGCHPAVASRAFGGPIVASLRGLDCEAVQASVRSEVRGDGTPTLELGDPAERPVLLFFHGWPDTSALWANQFAAFCGEDGEYACVAPSMMDYHPDVAPAEDASRLSWPTQADVLHEVVLDLGLEDVTLVMHDFGSIVGSSECSKKRRGDYFLPRAFGS